MPLDLPTITVVGPNGVDPSAKVFRNGESGVFIVTTDAGTGEGTSTMLDIETDFGAVGDGVTDDSGAFQAVIDQAVTDDAHKTVLVRDKPYLIDSPITFPVRALTNPMLVTHFVGMSPPPQYPYAPGDGINMPGNASGSILASSGGTVFDGGGTFRNFNLQLTNLTVRLPDNPAADAINAEFLTGFASHGLLVDVPGNWGDGIAEPTLGTYGLRVPGLQSAGQVLVKDTTILGYGVGLRHSEHLDLSGVTVYKCQAAVEIARGYHSAHYDRLMILWCPTGIQVDDAGNPAIPLPYLIADEINFEDDDTGWWAIVSHVSDPGNLLRGTAHVHRVLANVGVDLALTVDGATGFYINPGDVPSAVGKPNGQVLQTLDGAAVWAPAAAGGGDSSAAVFNRFEPGIQSTFAVTSGVLDELDTGTMTVAATVPAGGQLIVELECMVDIPSGSELSWGLMSGGVVLAGPVNVAYLDAGNTFQHVAHRTIVLDGLNPGSTIQLDWAAARTFGSGATDMYAGGTKGAALMRVTPVGPPVAAPTGPYIDAVMADMPLGFWLLGESAGTSATDISGNDRHGTYVSNPTLGDPGPGDAMSAPSFDTTAYVSVPANPFQTSEFTAEAWMRTVSSTWQGIVAQPAGGAGPYGYSLFISDTGLLRGEYDPAGGGPTDRFSDSNVADGFWHHVAFTADGAEVAVFVDGVEQDRVAQAGAIEYLADADLYIGALNGVGAQYGFNGQIAAVALYDHALTGSQLLAHYDAMPPALVFEDNFAAGDTSGWTVSSAWSEAPANWVTASGDGSGTTFLRRGMPTGGRYTEARVYMDGTGGNWVGIRPRDVNGAIYDNGTYGALLQGDGNIQVVWAGGTVDVDGTTDLPPSPTEADAVVMGVLVVDATTVEVYINGVMKERRIGMTPQFGAYLTLGVYNAASGHFDYVRCYTKRPVA